MAHENEGEVASQRIVYQETMKVDEKIVEAY
jgi:hypothetical protein